METEEALIVNVFPTCVSTTAWPGIVDACCLLAESVSATYRVVAPTSCCGQPAYSAGKPRDARRVAASALSLLAETEGPIVVPSGSCASFIRKIWPTLFYRSDDHLLAVSVAERTYELTEFFADIDLPFDTEGDAVQTVTYHDSCHGSRELGLGAQARTLLSKAGYTIVECEDPQLCCGFGGVFSQMLPEVSSRIAAAKAEMLKKAAPVISGGDAACLMHLRDSSESLELSAGTAAHQDSSRSTDQTAPRFCHIAELLAARVRIDDK
jgi:L-lactate dehydrogenase complex protein LldE